MWFFKDHPLSRRRAQSLLLCKGKAPSQHQLAPPSQKEGKQRDRERDRAAKHQWGPGGGALPTRCWGYLHYIHMLLSQFVQAGQHFQSLSREARKEKKTLRAKFAMHFPLQFAVHMELLCEFTLLIFVDTFMEIHISAGFSEKHWKHLSF